MKYTYTGAAIRILLSRAAKRQLDKVPQHVYRKYLYWVDLLKDIGLREARRYKGFHDEPLKGKRLKQRSVRLSRAYRVIYQEVGQSLEVIEVLEVNKHEY